MPSALIGLVSTAVPEKRYCPFIAVFEMLTSWSRIAFRSFAIATRLVVLCSPEFAAWMSFTLKLSSVSAKSFKVWSVFLANSLALVVASFICSSVVAS